MLLDHSQIEAWQIHLKDISASSRNLEVSTAFGLHHRYSQTVPRRPDWICAELEVVFVHALCI